VHPSRLVRALFVCAAFAISTTAFGGPLRVQSIVIDPPSVMSGQPVGATITLNGPAGKNGASVTLASSNSGAVTAPASLFFPQGQSSISMTMPSHGVATNTTVTITATLGISVSANVTVLPARVQQIMGGTGGYGGIPQTMTIYLTGEAPPGGATVTFGSTDPSLAQPQASVVVPAGLNFAQFTLTTYPTHTRTRVWISATHLGTVDTDFEVAPPDLMSVTVSPGQVTGGVDTATVSVNLTSPAPAGGIVIEMTSSDPTVVPVPSAVVVPEGASSTSFAVTPATVAATTNVTITGYRNFYFYQSTTLQVNP
jgi:hypothetical protein